MLSSAKSLSISLNKAWIKPFLYKSDVEKRIQSWFEQYKSNCILEIDIKEKLVSSPKVRVTIEYKKISQNSHIDTEKLAIMIEDQLFDFFEYRNVITIDEIIKKIAFEKSPQDYCHSLIMKSLKKEIIINDQFNLLDLNHQYSSEYDLHRLTDLKVERLLFLSHIIKYNINVHNALAI
ncbi:hypothetical protein [Photobacterium toruni]|mgnify:CR=1 FL=1|uniref:Uncharacterized protein n=1 Tax=Photobacterium toruni TaxID=1935446 RepID=A0ABU6L237_9GAMM|nr:hypothetical protein [Photobacterium toruni]MEC6813790.1 hypothetical protein [Photobacterium toruni]MEC6830345.1 hypothetical protein [Photobacterium toruni]